MQPSPLPSRGSAAPAHGWRALAEWLIAPQDPTRTIAFAGAAACAEPEYRARIAGWCAALQPHAGRPVALYRDDALDFSAAMLAALQLECPVVLPGDALPSTLQRLRADVAAFAGDFPHACVPRSAAAARESTAFRVLDPLQATVIVHTSGSTGEPLAIPKRLHQLQAEIDALEQRFGALLDAATIHATVSHQHIYGLLFRVLWPLCAGRAFAAQRLEYPEQIAAELGRRRGALVTSPAHLARLPDTLDWQPARGHAVAVFSSGGPLAFDAALLTARLLGHAPIEVYGSSETGGIAARVRDSADPAWQPLPGVAIEIDGDALTLRSPFLPPAHPSDPQPYRCSDRVEPLADGGFRLLGRADRIVKIEERRVALDVIEHALRALPTVRDARVLVLPEQRTVLGAVIALDAPPATAAARRALTLQLRAALAQHVDRVCLPRRWRYVDDLPADARGKTTDAALRALFRPVRPQPQWQQRTDDYAYGVVELTSELLPFDGHFDAAPVLPGVAMVDWTIHWATEWFRIGPPFARMERLKFQRLARPGVLLHVELKFDRGNGTLDFGFRSTEGVHAGGRIVFAADAAG